MRFIGFLGFGGLLVMLTACPEVETVHYEVDRKAQTMSVVYEGIRSDDPAEATEDYEELVDDLEPEKEDGFEVLSSELYEADGKLNARIKASFDDLGKVGFYKHDRRSPTIFCVDRTSSQRIASSNGTEVSALSGCVVWERKATKLEVSVSHEVSSKSVSLLEAHRAAQAAP